MLVNPAANLTLEYITIAHGAVDRDLDGGGIENDGTLTVDNSTFRLNRAGFGGAIANFGSLTVNASTFQENVARMGGDFFGGRTVVVTNSTFSGSSAEGTGGSILNGGGDVTVTNSTFVRIAAGGFGGAIGNILGTVRLKGTLLAESPNGNCGTAPGVFITDAGYNLSDDGSCNFTQSTSSNNVTMLDLDPRGLLNNGGPTETIALLADSVAIDKIPVADCTDLATGAQITTDQRGDPRPDPEDGPSGKCDIGAYEFQAPPTPAIDCSQASASAPNLVALPAVFFPESITGVVDPGGAFSVSIASVLQSKPVLRFPLCPNAHIAGSVAFVRATNQSGARRGNMLYGIGFTATDKKSGESCTGSVPVCVQDLRDRGQPCTGAATVDATKCR
jgi:hypothetical protein